MTRNSSFAQRMREALKDMTLTEFARKIGLAKQTISNYTTGVSVPKKPALERIAEELDVDCLWLAGYDVPRERNGSVSAGIFAKISKLNEEGTAKLEAYADDLILSGRYNKN